MKCISDLGNFSFNNLGTGVERTTSPSDENRTTKIFILIIIFFLSNLNLKSQNNLDSIVYQKKRIEFEISDIDRNFWIKESKKNFLILKDEENGKNLNWYFKFYNQKLNLINDTIIFLDRSYSLKKISSNKDYYNFFFKKNYSNEKKYFFLRLNPLSNSIIRKEIELPLSLTIRNVLFFDDNIIFLGNLKNGKNLVSVYNILTGQLNNIYEFLYYDNKIIDIHKNNDLSFYVLVNKENINNLKVIERKNYSLNRDNLNSYLIESINNSIIQSKTISIENKDFYISLVGRKNSNEANGFQINIVDQNSNVLSKKLNFLDINQLKNYFQNENRLLKKQIEKKNIEKLKLGYEFYIDTLFIENNEIHFSIESLKANFNNDGFSNYSYMPFYNSFTGRYDKKVNPKFGGFSHEINVYVILDFYGNIIWASIKKIDDLITFYNKPYKNYILRNDHIIDFYINKGKITLSKTEFQNSNNVNSTILDLNIDGNNIVLKSETNPEGIINWYDNNYLTYGVQNMKRRGSSKIGFKRVFYISNFEIH